MQQQLTFTDSHCHLDFTELVTQLPELLVQCKAKHINHIVVPAISPANWQQVLALTQAPQPVTLHPCLGIHPWFIQGLDQHDLQQLKSLVRQHHQQLVAIGEAGIDGTIAQQQNNLKQQYQFFEYQLTLAKAFQLPIIVHHRRSHQDVTKLLRQAQLSQAGIIHAFSGSYQQAKQYIDLGFKLGIGGTITYPRAEKTIKTIKKLPLSSLVLETDAPAMPLYGTQGQINSPLRLIDIFEQLATLRTEPKELLAEALENNIQTVLPKLHANLN